MQIYSTYNNVMLVPRRGPFGGPGATFQLAPVPEPGSAEEALLAAAGAAAQQAAATGQSKSEYAARRRTGPEVPSMLSWLPATCSVSGCVPRRHHMTSHGII